MKQKTKKSVSKKVKVTGSGKITRRSTGHNHYNSRDTGNDTRKKRRGHDIAVRQDENNIKKAIPYA